MNRHQLKPLTILTGEDNIAIYKIIDSISSNSNIDSIFMHSDIFRMRFYDESIVFFDIPEYLLEVRGRKSIDLFDHYDRTFMPIELNQLMTKKVVFYYFPETGLHPAKQRRLARYIARLVNAGVYFVIATHSTTIVREFNNLLLLSRTDVDYHKQVEEKFGYTNNEKLSQDQISMYATRVKEAGIFLEELGKDYLGFHETAFDDAVTEILNIQRALVYGMMNDE